MQKMFSFEILFDAKLNQLDFAAKLVPLANHYLARLD
jgi:hypothetical protein